MGGVRREVKSGGGSIAWGGCGHRIVVGERWILQRPVYLRCLETVKGRPKSGA